MTKEGNIKRLNKILHVTIKDHSNDSDDNIINKAMIDRVIRAINYCDKHNIEQPEIFPYADFKGIQFEWNCDPFYIEIDIERQNKLVDLFIQDDMNKDHDLNYTCNISMALDITKCFINIHNKTTEEN